MMEATYERVSGDLPEWESVEFWLERADNTLPGRFTLQQNGQEVSILVREERDWEVITQEQRNWEVIVTPADAVLPTRICAAQAATAMQLICRGIHGDKEDVL